jgi:hypothetical protein
MISYVNSSTGQQNIYLLFTELLVPNQQRCTYLSINKYAELSVIYFFLFFSASTHTELIEVLAVLFKYHTSYGFAKP